MITSNINVHAYTFCDSLLLNLCTQFFSSSNTILLQQYKTQINNHNFRHYGTFSGLNWKVFKFYTACIMQGCLSVSKFGAILMPVCSYNESPWCPIGKSISTYSSKSMLSKILSNLWLSSIIDMLRSRVKLDQPLTYNFWHKRFRVVFYNLSSSCNFTGHTSLAKENILEPLYVGLLAIKPVNKFYSKSSGPGWWTIAPVTSHTSQNKETFWLIVLGTRPTTQLYPFTTTARCLEDLIHCMFH